MAKENRDSVDQPEPDKAPHRNNGTIRFSVVESARGNLPDIIEGENLQDVIDEIGDRYGINSDQLKVFHEIRGQDREVYVILKGRAIIAEIQRYFET